MTTIEKTVRFTLGTTRASITAELRPMQNTGRTIDLQPIPADAMELSISGGVSGGVGQVSDHLRNLAEDHDAADVLALCDLWDRWHLNGLNPGTRAQRAALAEAPIDRPGFDYAKDFLAERGLNPDANTGAEPYAYGSAWLAEPLPADLGAEVFRLLEAIEGQRYGAEMTADDLADVDEVNENADTLDSREVIARLEALESYLADIPEDQRTPAAYDPAEDPHGDRGDEVEEYAELKELDREGSAYAGDWQHGETLIADSYFEEYAEQLAGDLGMINADAAWPANCINWAEAADQLKVDYTAIEFRGKTFWVR